MKPFLSERSISSFKEPFLMGQRYQRIFSEPRTNSSFGYFAAFMGGCPVGSKLPVTPCLTIEELVGLQKMIKLEGCLREAVVPICIS
jgi:hypothetical protein